MIPFVAIERDAKLVLAWHLGRRTDKDTEKFTEKLRVATNGHFEISTDGFQPYRKAIPKSLGVRTDFAQLVKVFATSQEGERRYSPPDVVEAVPKVIHGDPDPERALFTHYPRSPLAPRSQVLTFLLLLRVFRVSAPPRQEAALKPHTRLPKFPTTVRPWH